MYKYKIPCFAAIGAALLAAGLAAGNALAADKYPTKPIRFIVPFPPGGGTDIVARVIAQRMTEALGEQVVVDNRGGAGGTIGAEIAARAAPDGYTLIMVSGSYAVNPTVYKLSYDPVDGVTPVAQIATGPFVVVVHPSVPVKNIKELLALAKAKPGGLNFASTGTGGITHLTTELFKLMAHVNLTHIPYKGTGPAIIDLLGGQVQVLFGASAALVPHVRTGKLRALAVTGPERMGALPDLPTVNESGVPGYEVSLWYGVLGPKGLPKDIVTRWNSEIKRIVQTQEMKNRFASEGLTPAPGTPGDFAKVLKRDIEKWMKVVKDANVKAQ